MKSDGMEETSKERRCNKKQKISSFSILMRIKSNKKIHLLRVSEEAKYQIIMNTFN
jgi:hypothetical protein